MYWLRLKIEWDDFFDATGDSVSDAAIHYGDIRAVLERKGRSIGVNDLHIAGHARSTGLVLVTNTTREFERVEGLRVVDWAEQKTD